MLVPRGLRWTVQLVYLHLRVQLTVAMKSFCSSRKIAPEAETNKVLPQVIHLWSPLIDFFRCCGIIPLRRCSRSPYFECCLGSYSVGLLLFTFIFFTILISLLALKKASDHQAPMQVSEAVLILIYYIHCESTLAYFMLYSRDIIQLFQFWIDTERILMDNTNNIRLGYAIQVKCWIIYCASIVILFADNVLYIFSKVFVVFLC